MLHFNDLDYYALPDLPPGWQAPTRLKTELGIFAGRLYFEYPEYNDLQEYLGSGEGTAKLAETIDDTVMSAEPSGTEDAIEDAVAEAEIDTRAQQALSTARPLTFVQEWLALRRKGQDFTHTPMGHVCQGKPLTTSHPFFTRREDEGPLKLDGAATRMGPGKVANGIACSIGEVSTFSEEEYDGDDDYYGGEDDTGSFEDGEIVLDDREALS